MKNTTYLLILLAIALCVVSYKLVKSESERAADEITQNTAIGAILNRSSVRSYTEREVTEEQVDTLLRCAMSAPTAVNRQPWAFVVIRERHLLDSIAQKIGSMKMMKEVGLAVVVCGNLDEALEGEAQSYWVQDASAASENILVAAQSMGLGTVWCGVYPKEDRVEIFRALLKLPDHIVPLNCIAIGYPEGTPKPKDKWKPEKVKLNSWSTTYFK